jgi:hypothetical protein
MTTQYMGKTERQYPHPNKGVIDPKTGESLAAKSVWFKQLNKDIEEQLYHSARQSLAMKQW